MSELVRRAHLIHGSLRRAPEGVRSCHFTTKPDQQLVEEAKRYAVTDLTR